MLEIRSNHPKYRITIMIIMTMATAAMAIHFAKDRT
jgi:hypothetical protein